MTVTNGTTTPRYSAWEDVNYAIQCGPDYATWEEANDDLNESCHREDGYRIWDHSTTPPSDVTDADPEGAHPPTSPLIPETITKITLFRKGYKDEPPAWYVNLESGTWKASYDVAEANLISSLARMTEVMEAVK